MKGVALSILTSAMLLSLTIDHPSKDSAGEVFGLFGLLALVTALVIAMEKNDRS